MIQQINRQKIYLNTLWIWFFAIFILSLSSTSVFADDNPTSQIVAQGFVDSFIVDADNNFIAQGWAGTIEPSDKIISVSISVWLAETLVYEGAFERFDRPDVVNATKRSDLLKSGWRVNGALPDNLKNGKYPLKIQVKLNDGSLEKLGLNGQITTIFIEKKIQQATLLVKVILITLLVFLGTVYFQADFFANWLSNKARYLIKPPVVFGLTLLLSFLILIGMGITGSSLGLGFEQTPFVQSDITRVWLKNQPIRSDEWLVFTPLAIAQYNHQPKFPIVNTNLGEDGQNMLVVGITGVPVAHISALAKPASWGFFLFDLKRALSWYWFFPIFSCLFALWGVVSLLLPNQWKSSFLIALWFCVSPYVAAWSNWPAYTVFFPSLAFISAITILRSQSKYLLLALGCILGIALAGFVLILYPPFQVSVGYVFIAITVGIVVRDKLYRNINKFRLTSFAIAIIISGLILWEWWTDAHLAIQAMMATVYPGQRTSVTGGDITLPVLLRGFTNVVTLYKLDNIYTNQSEIASFYYMLLPLAVLFIIRLYQKAVRAVEIALAVSISFILYFVLVGIPLEVAQFSFWGRVPPYRVDIALGLSNIILCGVLLLSNTKHLLNKMPSRVWGLIVALIWAAIVFHSISLLHESILSDFSPKIIVGLFFVIVVSGYCLVMGKFRSFIYINLALSAIASLQFNPINIAPHTVIAAPFINEFHKTAINPRILILGTQIPAMPLLASGVSVANGIFYYPPKSLWERLDKNHTESNTYNRYQHLIFSGGSVENINNYSIELSAAGDMVRVVMNLERFDFRKTGAGFLAASPNEESALRKNPVLSYITHEKGWSWFQITEDLNAN